MILGALSNMLARGGGIKRWFPEFRGGKIINAVLFAACAWALSSSWHYGALMGLAMIAGQAPKLFAESSDDALAKRQVLRWSSIILMRGAIWCLPIALVSCLYYGWIGLIFFIPAALMPACYSPVWWYKGQGIINQWTLSELLFGFVLWLPLLFVI
jgi:hypothetical protein